MTKEAELALYKKALIDWEKPIKNGDYTEFGFCWYFLMAHIITNVFHDQEFKKKLPMLFKQRKGEYGTDKWYHYKGIGSTVTGRQQRVTALKNAIEILENELKGEV